MAGFPWWRVSLRQWPRSVELALPALFLGTLAVVASLYLALDFQRSRGETLDRHRAQAVIIARWLDRNLDRAAELVQEVSRQSADLCAPSALNELGRQLHPLPVAGFEVLDEARVACTWRPPQIWSEKTCRAGEGRGIPVPLQQSGNRTVILSVDAGCLLNPLVLAGEDDGVKLSFVPRLGSAPGVARAGRPPVVESAATSWLGLSDPTLLTADSASWPVAVVIGVPEVITVQKWAAGLPLQVSLIAGLGLALWFGPLSLVRRRLSVEGQVRAALRRGDFFLAYLPTVELPSRQWIGVEALLRWRHARHGVLMPNAFIPWIETSPLIYDTTRWVMVQAAQDLNSMTVHNPEFSMAVNLPPSQLSDPRLIDVAEEAFGSDPLALCRVIFELTERQMGDYTSPDVQQVIAALRARGAQFALDDFGVGFSNLSCLQVIEIDHLKIDRSFLQEWELTVTDPNILEAVVQLARELGVGLIAEGVETERQLERVRRSGIRFAQGYLFSRPLDLDSILSHLATPVRQPQPQTA